MGFARNWKRFHCFKTSQSFWRPAQHKCPSPEKQMPRGIGVLGFVGNWGLLESTFPPREMPKWFNKIEKSIFFLPLLSGKDEDVWWKNSEKPPKHIPRCHIHVGFEPFQGSGLHHCLGKVFQDFLEEVVLHVQQERFPMEFEDISACSHCRVWGIPFAALPQHSKGWRIPPKPGPHGRAASGARGHLPVLCPTRSHLLIPKPLLWINVVLYPNFPI